MTLFCVTYCFYGGDLADSFLQFLISSLICRQWVRMERWSLSLTLPSRGVRTLGKDPPGMIFNEIHLQGGGFGYLCVVLTAQVGGI